MSGLLSPRGSGGVKTNDYDGDASQSSSDFIPDPVQPPRSARSARSRSSPRKSDNVKFRPHTVSNANLYRRNQELEHSSDSFRESNVQHPTRDHQRKRSRNMLRPNPRLSNAPKERRSPSKHYRQSKSHRENNRNRHRDRRNDLPEIEESRETRRASAVVDSITQQIAVYSHDGLSKIKDFVKGVTQYMDQVTTDDDSRYMKSDLVAGRTRHGRSTHPRHTHHRSGRRRSPRHTNGMDIGGIFRTIQDANRSAGVLQKMWFQTQFGILVVICVCTVLILVPCTMALIWLAMGWEYATEGHYFWTVFSFFFIWIILSLFACSIVSFIYSQRPVGN